MLVLGLGADLVPDVLLDGAEVELHVLNAQQLLQVHCQQGEGLQARDELLVVGGEAHLRVAVSDDPSGLGRGVGDVFFAGLQLVAPVLEGPELGRHAQLGEQRERRAQRRAVGVVSGGRVELAPAEDLGGGQGMELHAEHKAPYGLIQFFSRAGDNGPQHFFCCQASTPLSGNGLGTSDIIKVCHSIYLAGFRPYCSATKARRSMSASFSLSVRKASTAQRLGVPCMTLR